MTLQDKRTSRRAFLGMGAAAFAAGTTVAAQKKIPRWESGEHIRVGLIMGEWSHTENCWAKLINGLRGENNKPHFIKRTGMYITHVWHINSEKAEEFAQKFKVPNVVTSFDDMIGKVDGVVIDMVFQTPWTYKLARPFLKAGIPVYIDRPFTDAVWKAKEMIALSKKHDTPVWSGSSLERMLIAGETILHNPPESILGYETWSEGSDPYDFYTHGVHGLWWSHKTAGGGIHAIAHKTKDWSRGGGTSTILYDDRGSGPFLGTVHHTKRDNCIIYTKFKENDRVFRNDYKISWDDFIWTPMIYTIQEIFEKGTAGMPDTHEKLLEKTKLFLAGFRSILRENGDFVDLDSLDEDWAVGCPYGQKFFKDIDDCKAYAKLFGPEKGEIDPPE